MKKNSCTSSERKKKFVQAENSSPPPTAHRPPPTAHPITFLMVRPLRQLTSSCRVSFIDFYLVFPTNFRLVTLPHTNTVIFLACKHPFAKQTACSQAVIRTGSTITEPGLSVLRVWWNVRGACARLETRQARFWHTFSSALSWRKKGSDC